LSHKFFAFYCILDEGTFTSVFSGKKKLIVSYKTVEIKVLTNFFFYFLIEESGSLQITTDPDSGGPNIYGSRSGTLTRWIARNPYHTRTLYRSKEVVTRMNGCREMLDSSKDSLKLDAMKRIIAMLAKVNDLFSFFVFVCKS
jgi:hypothetical protein